MILELSKLVIESFSNIGLSDIIEALGSEFFSTTVYKFYKLGDMSLRVLKIK